MNSTRYILTRTCLQEGSMRLLKFNEGYFPQAGPAHFTDEEGRTYEVQVRVGEGRIEGLGKLYRDHNLGVNDVMVITPEGPGLYRVELVVKPYASARTRGSLTGRNPNARGQRPGEGGRPQAGTTVREVRAQPRQELPPLRRGKAAPTGGGGRDLSGLGEQAPRQRPPVSPEVSAMFVPEVPPAPPTTGLSPIPSALLTPQAPRPLESRPAPETRPQDAEAGASALSSQAALRSPAPEAAPESPLFAESAPVAQPAPADPARAGEWVRQAAELARLTGYELTALEGGLVRLRADLGPNYSYSVMLAGDRMATTFPEWQGSDDYHLLVVGEDERPAGVARLTREALASLTEHARLAPLTALDLRGYWKAGHVDLESAASVAEQVRRALEQRAAFTHVLLGLARHPAHRLLDVPEFAAQLGSGVSLDELSAILETLARPPFSALSPLPEGQYLLRVGVAELLSDLSEYAQGVRRRLRA